MIRECADCRQWEGWRNMATDYLSQVVPVNETTRKMTPEEEAALLAATQGGAAQEPAQQEQPSGMVAPYYSGTGQRTGHLADGQQARLNSVLGALKAAQPATDTGLSNAEFMYQLDQLPALSSYVKYGKTLGKSSDQSTDSWARSMGASAVPVLEAMIRSGDNRAQNEVAGANQRMSLLGGAMGQLAEEPRPQTSPQNLRDYHANTMLQSADATLDRVGKQMLALENNAMMPGLSTWSDAQWAAEIAKKPQLSAAREAIMQMKAEQAEARALQQESLGRLRSRGNVVGVGGGQNMQTPVNGRPNAASKGAAMVTGGIPNAAKADLAARKQQPAGGSGPMAPAAGGGVMSPQAPARQGGGPTIWPASRFRPPVPPAQALPPITIGPGDFKTGAVPMPAQTGGAVAPVAAGGAPSQPKRGWASMENINRPAPEASAFPERPAQPARPTAPLIPSLMAVGSMIGQKIGPVAQQQALAREQAALPPQSSLLAKLQSLIQGQQANGPRAQLGAYMGGEYMDPERYIPPDAAISQYMARR